MSYSRVHVCEQYNSVNIQKSTGETFVNRKIVCVTLKLQVKHVSLMSMCVCNTKVRC